ncbi:MAG: hypothetical protein HMLKMBBP_01889 [Planctomycetes bacterium]|nr:hypothetical protein [Planctomycetota bacterium]
MTRTIYRFTFDPKVALDDVEASLLLAVFAAEGLHGAARVRMDASYLLAAKRRVCVIDASTRVGRAITTIFTSFVLRSFGAESVRVERIRKATDALQAVRR